MNLIIGIHMLSYARQISDRDPGSDMSSQQALCVILLLTPRNSNQEPVSEYYGVHGMRKLTLGMHCLHLTLIPDYGWAGNCARIGLQSGPVFCIDSHARAWIPNTLPSDSVSGTRLT